MARKKDLLKQIRRAIKTYPNDMELGYFVRREILLDEQVSKRNKKIHLENYEE